MATKKELFDITSETRKEHAKKSAPSLVAEIMRIAESSGSGRCYEGTLWTWNDRRNRVEVNRFTICRKQFGHRIDTIRWNSDRNIDEPTFARYVERALVTRGVLTIGDYAAALYAAALDGTWSGLTKAQASVFGGQSDWPVLGAAEREEQFRERLLLLASTELTA